MPTLVMSGKLTKLDGSVRAKAYSFFQKLQEDDTTPGLHVEPILDAVDPRVRTGRVDLSLCAVMFKLVGDGEPHYVMHGIWPHDEAIAVAKRVTLRQNPINGMPTIEEVVAAPEVQHMAPVLAPGISAPAAAEEPLLTRLGYTSTQLSDVLGLPPAVTEIAMRAPDDDAVLKLAQEHEGWIGLTLVNLAAGDPLEEIVTELGLESPPSTGDEETDLVRAIQAPAAGSDFAVIEGQDELRAIIDSGDFAAWRVFLHPEQRRYVTQRSNGPFRLSGGAGTGKTVVLVHRARHLARRNPGARIVLTTFTKNLADALQEQVQQLDPRLGGACLGAAGVYVTGADALASTVLREAPTPTVDRAAEAVLGESRHSPGRRTPSERWRSVVAASSLDHSGDLANADFLAAEYALVVVPNRIQSEAEYLRVRRPGRGISLDRGRRQLVWKLVESYRSQSRAEGTLDYAEALAVAAALLEEARAAETSDSTGISAMAADHVLVDEGQDLSPAHWQLLRALAPSGPDDLFIAEDSHQRIYARRVVLSRFGIKITGRSRRLTLNYRTTAQNLRYALDVLEGTDWVDLEGDPEATGYRSARLGPPPVRSAVSSLGDELTAVVRHIERWRRAGEALDTLAVLVPNRQQADRVVQVLGAAGIPAAAVQQDRPPSDRVAVMTRHRSKGTEFSRVVLTDVGWVSAYEKERLALMDEADRDDALLRERSLLYVAATRARDELVVIQR